VEASGGRHRQVPRDGRKKKSEGNESKSASGLREKDHKGITVRIRKIAKRDKILFFLREGEKNARQQAKGRCLGLIHKALGEGKSPEAAVCQGSKNHEKTNMGCGVSKKDA